MNKKQVYIQTQTTFENIDSGFLEKKYKEGYELISAVNGIEDNVVRLIFKKRSLFSRLFS